MLISFNRVVVPSYVNASPLEVATYLNLVLSILFFSERYLILSFTSFSSELYSSFALSKCFLGINFSHLELTSCL